MLLLVLFIYFLYRVLFLFRLIIYYSFYLFFNYLFLRRKFNINYLHIPNIDAVALSQSFNAVIHFIIYLCLNRFILVFNGIVLLFHLFIYELRVRAYIWKSFLISYFFLNYFCYTFVVLKLTLFCSFLVRKKVLNFNTFYFVN